MRDDSRSSSGREGARARRLARQVLASAEVRAWYRASINARARSEAEEELRRLAAHGDPASLRGPDAPAPRWTDRRLRAAAAVLLPLLATGLLWTAYRFRTGGDRRPDAAELLSDLLEVRRSNGEPDPEAVAWLERALPDERARHWLAADPGSPLAWDELKGRLPETMRGAGEEREERLLEPRGTIFDPRPRFRFAVPAPNGKSWTYSLRIECASSVPRAHAVTQGAEESGPLVLELPPGEELRIGEPCSWQVRLDPELHPDFTSYYRPDPASFRIEDPARREEILALAPTGDADLDRLLRAAAFLAWDAAADALAELEELSEDPTHAELELARYLEAGAHAILGDAARFRELWKEGRED